MATQTTDLTWPIIGSQIMSTVLTAGGQLQHGNASLAIGQRTQNEDIYEAQQLELNAKQATASGQIAAENQNLQTGYIVSQALARAAASGGGVSDPSVVNNIARIQGEGAYRANVARYEGTTQSDLMNRQARAKRFEGAAALEDAQSAQKASRLAAFSTVLSGAAKTMAQKYQVGLS